MKPTMVKVRLSRDLLDEAKQLVASGWYISISEVLRDGVRRLMIENLVREKIHEVKDDG